MSVVALVVLLTVGLPAIGLILLAAVGVSQALASAFRRTGCVCPPGANRECERVDCPRKAVKP